MMTMELGGWNEGFVWATEAENVRKKYINNKDTIDAWSHDPVLLVCFLMSK
jgi:hypothetical protein